MAKDVDLAYAAGIFDGEGSVSVSYRLQSARSKNQTFGVKVSVSQVDPEVITWLKDTFGGTCDSYKGSSKRAKIVFRWTLHCRKAADFLEAIVPFLKLKTARSVAAIRLARMARPRGATKGQEGMQPMTEAETMAQKPLAEFIRSENQRSNQRISAFAKWGVN